MPTTTTKRVRKPKEVPFQPVVSSDGKAVLPPETQQYFQAWYNNHTPAEQALIMEAYTMLMVPPINTAGYRAFFRTLRAMKSQGTVAVQPITAKF